ncbi:methyl-accepting chemotaxis protein [Cribrihabitans neustonicus]|uniref:methyl-accepting chemotaxis protein n=1 Tax=Cribrihabitans neustonicus TaxID=1429085 RepID=UPI003B5C700E
MKALSSLKIAYKLPLFVVGFGMLITAFMVVTSTVNFQSQAIRQANEQFEAMVTSRKTALETLIGAINADLRTLADTPSTATALQRLSAAWGSLGADAGTQMRETFITSNPHPEGERHLLDRGKNTIPYNIHHSKFHHSFRTLLTAKGYTDAFLVSVPGEVIYTVFKRDEYGTNLVNGPYKDSDAAKLFQAALEAEDGTVLFSDIAPYAADGGAPAAFVATKVGTDAGATAGVLILRVPVNMMNTIMNDAKGIGETAEVYLIGQDLRARSNSRFDGGHAALEVLPGGPHIQAALDGTAGFFAETTGLRGQSVAAYAAPVPMLDTTWAIAIEQDRAELLAPVARDRNIQILISLAGAALLSVFGWLFARSITRPLDGICRSMEAVSGGNFGTDVREARRGDEIGKIGKTLVSLQDDLREGRAAEEQRAQQQQEQEAVVASLSAGLVRLAGGDFSQPIKEPFPAGHEQLRHDFNMTVKTLHNTIAQVIEVTSSIRNGAGEISQSSDDLSRRTETQAATLEETAAALDELTASVKSAAEGARSVESTMGEARTEAEASSGVVRDAVAAMTEIEQSSSHISQIIGVIDDIAFQTNLLALNAGVEAARAGEAGKGFAVVASEVRALAQRSSDAAMEIKTLIGDSSKHVARGVDLVGKTGEALSGIVSRVSHIAGLVSGIAEGAAEQSTGLAEINTGVSQLDQVTQENAAMVEEATAAGHMLNSDASKLADLVSRFNLGTATLAKPAESAPAPAAAPHTASAHGADWDAGALPPRSAKVAVEGNAAKDLWQDF